MCISFEVIKKFEKEHLFLHLEEEGFPIAGTSCKAKIEQSTLVTVGYVHSTGNILAGITE